MKTIRPKSSLLAALAALALAPSVGLAANDIHFGPTGSETSTANSDGTWINMWGPGYRSTTFDTSTPPPSGNTLGSVYNQGDWTGDSGGMDNYNMISPGTWWGNVVFDATAYLSIEMDFKYDTNSTMTPGTAAHLNIGFDKGYSFVQLTNLTFNTGQPIADGNWHHLSIPINPSTPNISSCDGVSYYQWNPGGTSGTMNFWMANVSMIARAVAVAPPTVSPPFKATKGLNVFASTMGNSFYDRQEVQSRQPTGLTWVGNATSGNPVSYSFTITDYPKSPNCEAYMFLVPDPANNEEAPDWNRPNCVRTFIQGNSTSATLHFQYKVNEDGNQGMYTGATNVVENPGGISSTNFYTNAPGTWDGVAPHYLETGDLGFVTNNGVLGTWTVRFTSDTNVTLIAPNGNTSTCVIPSYNTHYFGETTGFGIYLGMQANNADAMNQAVVYSDFAVTGVPSAYSDNFLTDSTLNTNLWNNAMAHGPAGVLVVPASAADWIRWTLPDNFFNLQDSSSVNGPWTELTSDPLVPLVGFRAQLLASSEIPAGNTGFFRLLKRPFTQLQVLLPGETNAPDTVSGKTGTPTPVNVGDLVTVTVNAVDPAWHIVNVSGQTIHMTTTDSAAITPNDAALSGGTMSGVIQFNSQGSWTVTASDVTDPTKTPNTSSALTVQ